MILFSDEHPRKGQFPKDVTEDGIVILVSDEHLKKA